MISLKLSERLQLQTELEVEKTLENPDFGSGAEGARLTPNLSGKRTDLFKNVSFT